MFCGNRYTIFLLIPVLWVYWKILPLMLYIERMLKELKTNFYFKKSGLVFEALQISNEIQEVKGKKNRVRKWERHKTNENLLLEGATSQNLNSVYRMCISMLCSILCLFLYWWWVKLNFIQKGNRKGCTQHTSFLFNFPAVSGTHLGIRLMAPL